MNEIGTIQAAFFQAILRHLRMMDFDISSLIERTAFNADQLNDPDARIPRQQFFQFWQALSNRVHDPAIAVRMGEMAHPRFMGVLGGVIAGSKTLREGLHQIVHYRKLIDSEDYAAETIGQDRYTFIYIPQSPASLEPAMVELRLVTVVTLARMLTQTNVTPIEIRFRYPAPAHIAHYERIFRCDLHFEQADNAIVWDTRSADLLLPQYNDCAQAILRRHVELLLEQLQHSDNLVGRVQQYISDTLRTGRASLDGCAAALYMGRRTLHRRLSNESTSFQKLHDMVRRQLAFKYLAEKNLSTADVATLLGFSESSAFHRAFKRWSGHNPADFSLRHRSDRILPCPTSSVLSHSADKMSSMVNDIGN
ncbi:MAG: AraC family transcriptional regulator [Gammaproteobacteria bacterium]|nr:AraC family transcriptional regulator [Gammaproteobacteria bacterium]